MEAFAQDVINRYELGKKGLDIEEQKLVKDIILGMLEIAFIDDVEEEDNRNHNESQWSV